MGNSKYYDTMVMYGDNADNDTLAHEVWHVIENNQGWHTPYRDWTVRYPFKINLMIGESDSLNNPVQVHNSVRLDQKQQDRADDGTEPNDPKLLY